MFTGFFLGVLFSGFIYLISCIYVAKSHSKIEIIRAKTRASIELSEEEALYQHKYERENELESCLESMIYDIYCGKNPFENYELNNELEYITKEECISAFEKMLNTAGYFRK